MKRPVLLLLLLYVTNLLYAEDVVAYVTSWSSGLPDPSRMTHINYAFGHVGGDFKSVTIDNTSRLQQIAALKKRNSKLKVLLSIGGWGSGNFSEMAADQTLRQSFCKAARNVCDRYGLDGIDIDWEFPGSTAGGLISASKNDKANYTLLMRDLRAELGDELLLTMASNYEPTPYDFRSFIQYMDFINVMCYNMASPPNHHAALYKGGGPVSKGYYSSQMAMNAHINAGVPRDKLVMGMPLYGHESNKGEQSYQRALDLLATGNYVEDWDDKGKVPWIKKKSDGSFYMDFDNPLSIEYKCRYIIGQHFRGGMYWDYYSDDKAGTLRNTVYKFLIKGDTQDAAVSFNGEEMPCIAFQLYQADVKLKQGVSYTLTVDGKTDPLEADWDFFSQQTDGTLRFLAIDGNYRLTADLDRKFLSAEVLDNSGNPATLASNGTGAVWVIGNAGMGKPTYQTAGAAWDEDNAFCMAPVEKKTHQFTLQVGRQLDAENVNFKFFHQKGWGGEFKGGSSPRITSLSSIFGIGNGSNGHDDGNVFLMPDVTLQNGSIYRFTLRFSLGITTVNLRVEDVTAGLPRLVVEQELPQSWFRLDGTLVPQPDGYGIFIHKGKKILSR